ncbi:hypothetical protein JHK87_050426 [Glycine soja]|nr:hypothetical protein JHK87_050426 [Glycine soja]
MDHSTNNQQFENFFAKLREIEGDPLHLLFTHGFGGANDERESKVLDPLDLFDWPGDINNTNTNTTLHHRTPSSSYSASSEDFVWDDILDSTITPKKVIEPIQRSNDVVVDDPLHDLIKSLYEIYEKPVELLSDGTEFRIPNSFKLSKDYNVFIYISKTSMSSVIHAFKNYNVFIYISKTSISSVNRFMDKVKSAFIKHFANGNR